MMLDRLGMFVSATIFAVASVVFLSGPGDELTITDRAVLGYGDMAPIVGVAFLALSIGVAARLLASIWVTRID